MKDFLAEIRRELADLPRPVQEKWWRWFWQAWPEAEGDWQRAAAQAWEAFTREAKGKAATPGREGGAEPPGGAGGGRLRRLWGKIKGLYEMRREDGSGCRQNRGSQVGTATITGSRLEEREVGGRGQGAGERDFEAIFAEAVAHGWLKPEQRLWAEALVRQDWSALREFLDLAAALPGGQASESRTRPW